MKKHYISPLACPIQIYGAVPLATSDPVINSLAGIEALTEGEEFSDWTIN